MEAYVDTLRLLTHHKKDNNNLKTKNNQNWQKFELYGSPTTKEIKKKHLSRPVGEAEMGSWEEENLRQHGRWTQTGDGLWNEWGRQCNS